ncbi:GGDEF domain-containing protein [Clostridium sediminicola]|uniref:GGDEF domain-containing protein n=1 Tax=Clostridium sediminicola TaxID=3114879 RepID=UPI003D169FC2
MMVISIIFITIIINIILRIHSKQVYEKSLLQMNQSLEKNVKERTKELRELAVSDSLTKLYNHNTSFELLEKEIGKIKDTREPLSIMMLDLDYFKKVNDNYGHQAGDEVLWTVAQAIKSNIRTMDIAGRYGGEEFLIILPNTDIHAAVLVSEKVKLIISQIIFDYKGLNITCSLGTCTWKNESAVEFVSKADKLLYKAKTNGRNRVEWY